MSLVVVVNHSTVMIITDIDLYINKKLGQLTQITVQFINVDNILSKYDKEREIKINSNQSGFFSFLLERLCLIQDVPLKNINSIIAV